MSNDMRNDAADLVAELEARAVLVEKAKERGDEWHERRHRLVYKSLAMQLASAQRKLERGT